MKKLHLLIILTLTLLGCTTSTVKSEANIEKAQYEVVTGKKYFDYDQIDHYFNDFDDRNFLILTDNQFKSALDSIKGGVLIGQIPMHINDTSFIDKLTKIDYVKKSIPKEKFQKIDEIFIEKIAKENRQTKCVYIYRDILVFKKHAKIIGVSKICFGCMGNHIVGTNADTKDFGQNGDYEKLEKILRQ